MPHAFDETNHLMRCLMRHIKIRNIERAIDLSDAGEEAWLQSESEVLADALNLAIHSADFYAEWYEAKAECDIGDPIFPLLPGVPLPDPALGRQVAELLKNAADTDNRDAPAIKDFTYANRGLLERAFGSAIAPKIEGDARLHLLFVMREDYIAHLDPHLSFLPDRLRFRFRLEPLSPENARQAIVRPVCEILRTDIAVGTPLDVCEKAAFGAGAVKHLIAELCKIRV